MEVCNDCTTTKRACLEYDITDTMLSLIAMLSDSNFLIYLTDKYTSEAHYPVCKLAMLQIAQEYIELKELE